MMSYMKGSPIYHPWRLQLYSTPDRIHQLQELEQLELIVVEEALHSSLIRRIEASGGVIHEQSVIGRNGAVPIITLVSDRRIIEEHELHKFQAASSLLHGMQMCYERFRSGGLNKLSVTGSKSALFAFCSMLEQAGKTMMALHAAALLAHKGYRVFYCNLELWNTAEDLMELAEQQQASYSDLMYLIKSKQQTANWLAKHAIAVNSHSFFTLRAFQHESDRAELAAEDVKELIAALHECGLYDYIVVDLPTGMNNWTLPIIQQCDIHYLLMLPQPRWQKKHQLALAYAQRQYPAMMEELKSKRYLVMNELYGSADVTSGSLRYTGECLPHVAAWHQHAPILLGSASYRAAVERCIRPFLISGEKAG